MITTGSLHLGFLATDRISTPYRSDHLRNAVTFYSTLVNLARIFGPAIAAALISAVGLAPCFIIF